MHQVDKDQYEKVLRYIDIGKREGATLVTGGKPCGDKGYYIEPTIFTDVKVKCFADSSFFSMDMHGAYPHFCEGLQTAWFAARLQQIFFQTKH
jgi:hypothetical protein